MGRDDATQSVSYRTCRSAFKVFGALKLITQRPYLRTGNICHTAQALLSGMGESERKKKEADRRRGPVGRQYQRVDRNGLCQLN